MVFFVCGACGDSFKRKQAEQHTFRCRNWCFSCMDCNRDFEGRSFAQHTQCITESEKNFGSYHVAKAGKDKNEAWMEKLRKNLSNRTDLKPFHKRIVDKLITYPNIPRKNDKFSNFLKTSVNLHNPSIVNELWMIVQKAASDDFESKPNKENKNDKQTPNNEDHKPSNGTTPVEEKTPINGTTESNGIKLKEKNKKRKMKESDLEETNDTDSESDIEEKKPKLSKSQKKKMRKLNPSSTEEPDSNAFAKQSVTDEDITAMSTVSIETVQADKKFKWRRSLKDILREGPSEGLRLSKILNKIEQMHNHPLTGVQYKLDKDTLKDIMMKNLNKKPFSIIGSKAVIGKYNTK